jgi:pyruvate formate lyase activating enzyme
MFLADGGEEKTAAELADFCTRYRNYYGHNGGVTLSGGEPLMQAAGALELAQRLKERGIHVALDTSGAVFAPEVLNAVDLTILDIKHTDPAAFLKLTGHGMDNTLKALHYLRKHVKRFWIRQVIVPNITDSVEQVAALKKMATGAEKIELLPYHTAGAFKWEKCGMTYPLGEVKPPDEETMRKLQRIIEN